MRKQLVSLLLALAWIATPVFAQDGLSSDGDGDEDRANLNVSQFMPQASAEPRLKRAFALSDLDGVMMDALQKFAVPGASLAVATSGRLVYAKGFGLANLNTNEPVTPTTLFNLASCTKAVSTLGVLTLVNSGRLDLDSKLYDVVGRPRLPREPDPRMLNVTIRQLLHHSAGWNDDGGYQRAYQWLRRESPQPLPFEEALPFLLATPLDYDPGTQANYANGDWNIIKYVIECAAQQPYRVVMREILAGIGIYSMKEEHRGYFPGEAVRYAGDPPRQLPAGKNEAVPLRPSFGNWLASAVDMAKFLTATDGTRCPRPYSDKLYDDLLAPLPPPMTNRPNGSHYGLGLDAVKAGPEGVFYTKNGGKAGVHAQIEHLPNGVDVVLLMNGGAAEDGSDANPLGPTLKEIRTVVSNIDKWPAVDLFETLGNNPQVGNDFECHHSNAK